MGKNAWLAFSIVGILCMAALIALSVFMGGCTKMIQTAAGGSVEMKCHWTFIATAIMGVVGLVSTVSTLVAKTTEGRRIASLMTLFIIAAIAFITSPFGIGLCASTDMHCHDTALYVWIVSAIGFIVACIQCVRANPGKANEPKMKI